MPLKTGKSQKPKVIETILMANGSTIAVIDDGSPIAAAMTRAKKIRKKVKGKKK